MRAKRDIFPWFQRGTAHPWAGSGSLFGSAGREAGRDPDREDGHYADIYIDDMRTKKCLTRLQALFVFTLSAGDFRYVPISELKMIFHFGNTFNASLTLLKGISSSFTKNMVNAPP